MDISLFILLFLALGAVYIVIGWRASQTVSSLDDYFLAGRQIGIFPLTVALIATQLGGGVILSNSYESYFIGLYGILYTVGICLGFLLLGLGIAAKMRALKADTTAEVFEIRYKSATLKKIASLLFIASLAGILVGQIVASRSLMLSLNVYTPLLFVVFWGFIISYTMLGGLRAIVNNDIFQLTFIVTVFCAIFGYEIVTQGYSQTLAVFGAQSSYFSAPAMLEFGRLFSIVLIPMCYSLMEQDIAQSIFAARTKKIALIGSLLASICMFLFSLIPVYFGMKTRILEMVIPLGANPLIYFFDKMYPSAIVTLVIYGVFAAIISTSDALLCAISSHCVRDFELAKDNKRGLLISKGIMLSVGIAAFIISMYFTNILSVLVGSYAVPVSALFVPIIIAYFTKRVSLWGAYASIVLGLGAFILFRAFHVCALACPEGIALALSALGYAVGALIEKLKH